jgi:hypothetical protein
MLDEGEGGLSGVTVQLRRTDDIVVAEATTGLALCPQAPPPRSRSR